MNFSQTPINGTFSNTGAAGPGLLINVFNIDPNNTPHNFHCIRPDYSPWPATQNDPGYPFGKEFLQALAPFCSIRFGSMAFSNKIVDWSDRPSPVLLEQRASSIETMIAIANAANCDMWIQLPFNANADFDTNFANLIKNTLHSNLHCRYEVSDELWNFGYPYEINSTIVLQNTKNQIMPAGMPGFIPGVKYWKAAGEEIAAQLMSHAVNIQPILGSRGIPVLAGQFTVVDYEAGGLQWIKQQMNIDPAKYGIEIAGAPYFGVNKGSITDNSSADDIFQGMTDYLNGVVAPCLTQQMALAHQYGVPFDCYEWAQGLSPTDQTQFNLMQAAQTDPRMGAMYQQSAQQLINAGANLVMNTGFVAPDSVGVFGRSCKACSICLILR